MFETLKLRVKTNFSNCPSMHTTHVEIEFHEDERLSATLLLHKLDGRIEEL